MNWDLTKMGEQLQKLGTEYGIKILAAIAILVIGRIVAGFIRFLVRKTAKKTNMHGTVSKFLSNIVYAGIMVFSVVAAIGQLGVQTTSFIAVIGAAGLAMGLAFQGSLGNFAAGFLLVLFRPFKVDDFIEGAGVTGEVKEIDLFTTTIMTPDNKRVIVPNSKLTGDNIINYTAEPQRRVDLVIGVSYSDDLDKVRTVIQDELSGMECVLKDPEPQIAVKEMAGSSVNFVVRPWTKTPEYWDTFFKVTENLKKRFDKEGISIPFPQRDVHMIKEA